MRKLIFPALALAAAAAVGAPALAQSTVESVTVLGQWNGRGEPPASLSRVVDIADLDLRAAADQAEARHRIVDAARDVCDELGQDRPNKANLGRSCQDEAIKNADDQLRVAVADAYARPAYVVAAPAEGADTAYVAPVGPTAPASDSATTVSGVTSADTAAAQASYTTSTVSNGPVPDTPANRARYGQPMSHAGKQTRPVGN